MTDELHTLLFSEAHIRAHLVQLENAWQQIVASNTYPLSITRCLGELVAASALLSATLKFEGSLVLQIRGDGPVSLMVAECNHLLELRGVVKLRADAGQTLDDVTTFPQMVNAHGKGLFSIILDPAKRVPGQQPYQGIVGIEGDSIAECLCAYLKHSEQIASQLWLDAGPEGIGGLLVQQMPAAGGSGKPSGDTDAWRRLGALGNTLQPGELSTTAPDTLARRLFWEETVQRLKIRQASFQCSCSREKVARMLHALGIAEINQTLQIEQAVVVNCDYCNTEYRFDAVDCAAIFAEEGSRLETIPDNHGRILH
jgi:molecular chaperone Hsp33